MCASVAACLAVAAFLSDRTIWPAGDTRTVERSLAKADLLESTPNQASVAEKLPIEQPLAVVQDEGPSVASSQPDASPTPVAPTPVAPTPVAPTPVAPTPVAPTPIAPTPEEPTFESASEPTLVERVKALEEEAVSITMRLIEEFPNSTDPLVLLGKVHNRNLNFGEAIRCWEQCVEQNPKRADAYDAIALAAYKVGDFEKAVAAGSKAIAIAPNMRRARVHLGQTLLAMGKTQEAVAALQQEPRFAPNSAEAHCSAEANFLLGQAHRQLEDYEKALGCYEKAIELRPDYTDAYYAMAALCARRRMLERAAEYRARFKELKTADRQSESDIDIESLGKATLKLAMTYCDAGRLYRGHGKLQQAEQHWLKAAAIDPRNVRSRKALIRLYQKNNRTAEALVICEQLREALPENAESHAFVALLSAQSAQFDAAESAIRRALELDPDNASYRHLNEQLRRRK